MSTSTFIDYIHFSGILFEMADDRLYCMRRYSNGEWFFTYADGTDQMADRSRFEEYDKYAKNRTWIPYTKEKQSPGGIGIVGRITDACAQFSVMVHGDRTKMKDLVTKEQVDAVIDALCSALDAAEVLSNEISGNNVPQAEK